MLVVSLALVAVLVASGDDDTEGDTLSARASATATPPEATATSVPAETPSPTPIPPVPVELRQRIDDLPEKLRNETLSAYSNGRLSLEQLEQIATDYEHRNPAVRVGTVIAVEDAVLRFEVFTTGEQAEVATDEQTLIRRGDQEIGLEDLASGELVMVVSTDDGAKALTIEAFGVAAP